MSDIRDTINTTLNGFVAKFQEHPKKNGQTYTTHFMQSMYFSLCSLACAMMFALHAIFPMLFETTGGNVVEYLHNIITLVRNNAIAIAETEIAKNANVTSHIENSDGDNSEESSEEEDSSEGADSTHSNEAVEVTQGTQVTEVAEVPENGIVNEPEHQYDEWDERNDSANSDNNTPPNTARNDDDDDKTTTTTTTSTSTNTTQNAEESQPQPMTDNTITELEQKLE